MGNNIDKYGRTIIFLILFLYSILLIINSPSIPFANREVRTDSSVFLYIGNAMKQGILPYRDIFDHKDPLIYIFNFLRCLLSSRYGIWFIELICIYISVVFSYLTCNKITNNKFISFVTVVAIWSLLNFYYEGGNLVEEYSLPFIFISLYYFVCYYLHNSISLNQVSICGMCISAVLLLRPNMIGLWMCFCFCISIDLIIHRNWNKIILYILFFSFGLLLALLPVLLFSLITGSLKDFVNSYIVFNLRYSKSEGDINNIFSSLFFLIIKSFIPYILIFYTFIIFNMKTLKNRHLIIIALINFIVNTILMSMAGRKYAHYGMILIPCILFMSILLLDSLLYILKRFKTHTIYLIVVIIFLSCCGSNIYLYGKHIKEYLINIKTPVKQDILINNVFQNSNKSDPIIVIGNKCNIYLKSSRMAASKYIYQYPIGDIDNKIISQFIKDIYTNKPKIIVAVKSAFKRVPDELKGYINDRYINIFEDRTYILYKFGLQD